MIVVKKAPASAGGMGGADAGAAARVRAGNPGTCTKPPLK